MKKILGFILMISCMVAGFSSCTDDSNAEATCTYYVMTDSIVYTDTLDAQYDTLIQKSLVTLEHSSYTFQESAKVDQSMPAFAVAKCNDLAAEQFTTNLAKSVTLSDVQNEMYKEKSDYFTSLGITNAAAIGLHPFTVYLSLWNLTNNVYMGQGELNVTP